MEVYKCRQCGQQTDTIVHSRKSSLYGVIFEGEELCEACAAERYRQVISEIETYGAGEGFLEKEVNVL